MSGWKLIYPTSLLVICCLVKKIGNVSDKYSVREKYFLKANFN